MRQHTIALTERERLLGEGCNAANRTKAAGFRICHLIDEDWIYPECIPWGGGSFNQDLGDNLPLTGTLDIGWKNGQSTVPYLYGIVQFVGERKDKMRIVYSTKVRPSSFQASEAFFWLTKKVK
jgi:hypothetical protein